MTTKEILSLLDGVKRDGNGWTALCPGHEDRTPSLSVTEKRDGRTLLNCFAGCAQEAVVTALGITMADLFPEKSHTKAPSKITATYDYVDEDGNLLFQVVRHDPKGFKQRRPKAQGGWIWDLKGVQRVLYRLPEVQEAIALEKTVHVVEGEKDADLLASMGLAATTSPGGAGKWKPEFTEALAIAGRRPTLTLQDGNTRRPSRLPSKGWQQKCVSSIYPA